mmetsp:Transcript_50100/g.160298  ORF Transcript_50100/g.160298 Transcript_50100/m.160298 type:complete len:85 (-) Transcript_50100:827-1081(-)
MVALPAPMSTEDVGRGRKAASARGSAIMDAARPMAMPLPRASAPGCPTAVPATLANPPDGADGSACGGGVADDTKGAGNATVPL